MKTQTDLGTTHQTNRVLETLRLLGVGVKSFNINFEEQPVYLLEHEKKLETTSQNHDLEKRWDTQENVPVP